MKILHFLKTLEENQALIAYFGHVQKASKIFGLPQNSLLYKLLRFVQLQTAPHHFDVCAELSATKTSDGPRIEFCSQLLLLEEEMGAQSFVSLKSKSCPVGTKTFKQQAQCVLK